jgi:hypothetical protein
LKEKSEGSFGSVFTGPQKQQNPHKAGFDGASYLVGWGNLNWRLMVLIIIKIFVSYIYLNTSRNTLRDSPARARRL